MPGDFSGYHRPAHMKKMRKLLGKLSRTSAKKGEIIGGAM